MKLYVRLLYLFNDKRDGAKTTLDSMWRRYTTGKLRFMHLRRGIPGIGAKMLTRELQEPEQNDLIVREVMITKPVTVDMT